MSIQMDQKIGELEKRLEILEKQVKALVAMMDHKPQTLSLKQKNG